MIGTKHWTTPDFDCGPFTDPLAAYAWEVNEYGIHESDYRWRWSRRADNGNRIQKVEIAADVYEREKSLGEALTEHERDVLEGSADYAK